MKIFKNIDEKFEDLGIVRDGSSRNKSYEKGYHHTEIVGLTKNKKQPISLFSKIHSSTQKDFVSANDITFEGIDKIRDKRLKQSSGIGFSSIEEKAIVEPDYSSNFKNDIV